MKNMKLNKKVLRIISITDDVDDKSYWLKKKPQDQMGSITVVCVVYMLQERGGNPRKTS